MVAWVGWQWCRLPLRPTCSLRSLLEAGGSASKPLIELFVLSFQSPFPVFESRYVPERDGPAEKPTVTGVYRD